MNVLHLIAPVAFGGGESLLVSLLNERRPELREMVASVYTSRAFNAELDAIGIPHWEMRATNLGHGVSKLRMGLDSLWNLLSVAKLARIVRHHESDIVHAHGFPASIIFPVLRRMVPVKGIYTHHSYRHPPSRLERHLLYRAYNSFGIRTAVSDTATRSLNEAFPDVHRAFRAIHNCVSENFYEAVPDPEFVGRVPKGKTVFIQVARFSPVKNHRRVVEALARLSPAQREKILVVFAGDGGEKASVMALVRAKGLKDYVWFLGAVPHERVPGLLAAADFGLFPSENEAFGIAAAECMAAGMPVLAFDTPLMREIVGEGGLLTPRESLDKAFLRMLDTGPALREKARRKAALYRPACIKDQYLTCYQELARLPL